MIQMIQDDQFFTLDGLLLDISGSLIYSVLRFPSDLVCFAGIKDLIQFEDSTLAGSFRWDPSGM